MVRLIPISMNAPVSFASLPKKSSTSAWDASLTGAMVSGKTNN